MPSYSWLNWAMIVDAPADLPADDLPGQGYVVVEPLRLYICDDAGVPQPQGITEDELDDALSGVDAATLGGHPPEYFQQAGNFAEEEHGTHVPDPATGNPGQVIKLFSDGVTLVWGNDMQGGDGEPGLPDTNTGEPGQAVVLAPDGQVFVLAEVNDHDALAHVRLVNPSDPDDAAQDKHVTNSMIRTIHDFIQDLLNHKHVREHTLDSETDHTDVENADKGDDRVQAWDTATGKHVYRDRRPQASESDRGSVEAATLAELKAVQAGAHFHVTPTSLNQYELWNEPDDMSGFMMRCIDGVNIQAQGGVIYIPGSINRYVEVADATIALSSGGSPLNTPGAASVSAPTLNEWLYLYVTGLGQFVLSNTQPTVNPYRGGARLASGQDSWRFVQSFHVMAAQQVRKLVRLPDEALVDYIGEQANRMLAINAGLNYGTTSMVNFQPPRTCEMVRLVAHYANTTNGSVLHVGAQSDGMAVAGAAGPSQMQTQSAAPGTGSRVATFGDIYAPDRVALTRETGSGGSGNLIFEGYLEPR